MRNSKLPKQEQTRLILRFCQALAQIKSPEEAAAFITDLLSKTESEMLAKRLKIAEELIVGKKYNDISDNIKVGFSTVARVSEWLKISGAGYRTIIERLGKLPEITSQPVRLSQIEKRYPSYYWPQIMLREVVRGASKRQKERLEKTLSQLSAKSDLYRELSALLKPARNP